MAISAPTARGTIGERVSDTSTAISPSAAITVGKIACLSVCTDNIQTTDGASTNHSVTDTDGHTWTKIFEHTESSGVAADGVTSSLWMTKVTAEIGTGDAVTLTLTGAVLSKALVLFEFTVGAGNTFAVEGVNHTLNPSGAGTETVTLGSLTSREYLFCGSFAGENETLTTEDSQYTNMGQARSSTSGVADTNVTLTAGVRILTGTTDTYNTAGAGPGSNLTSLAAIYEVAGAAVTRVPRPTVVNFAVTRASSY